MRTDFSEFSFGYALVEEFARSLRPSLTAAPVFPSLIEEGRDGGGYDVKFGVPGLPLMLQFKRPDVMLTKKAFEISVRHLPLKTPFYRFHIRSSSYSKQHDLLLGHDKGRRAVFYASPCFHLTKSFDKHYVASEVIKHTIFVRPRDVGPLSAEPHHVSYRGGRRAWLFSDDPRELRVVSGGEIEGVLMQALAKERRPIGGKRLRVEVALLERALRAANVRPTPSRRRLIDLPEPKKDLARLAELTSVHLGAQLFIVQKANPG